MTDDATLSDFDSVVERAETGDTADRQADSSEGDGETGASSDRATPESNDGMMAAEDGETTAKATASGDSAEAGQLSRDSELSTYAWGTYTCGRCETETGRVWREDGEFVCPDCKLW